MNAPPSAKPLSLSRNKVSEMENLSDLQFLKERYATARNKYKPSHIKVLLIAEAPPSNLERYFYFEDVKKQDSLFLEVMGVLYPDFKQQYLNSGRDSLLKQELLERFQEDGYWLLDLFQVPIGLLNEELADCLPSLLQRLDKFLNKETTVILIKVNIYEICYLPLLSNGFKVSKERLPFPGSGQQRVFREKFQKALASL